MKQAVDLRDAFFDQVTELAKGDPNLIILTDDQAAWGLEWLKDNRPKQYLNTGIAEQNMIGVAAGLTLSGKKVLCFGQANFMTLRCLEFIKNDLCIMNLPVTIAVFGPGYTFGFDGPTHHGVQDVAVMRSLPNMTIFNPADVTCTRWTARAAYENDGPTYVRIERGTPQALYPTGFDFPHGFSPVRLSLGADVVIVATGNMVHTALSVADLLEAEHSVLARVIDVYRLKPVELSLLKDLATAPTVSIDEHSAIGGLASIVDSLGLARVKHFALPDEFVFEYGTRDWMQERAGLTPEAIAREINLWLR